jgi:hypothetical protein
MLQLQHNEDVAELLYIIFTSSRECKLHQFTNTHSYLLESHALSHFYFANKQAHLQINICMN